MLINEKVDFTLDVDGEPLGVRLMGTTPTHYSIEDIGDAIAQVYEDEYGAFEGTFFEVPEGQGRAEQPGATRPLRRPEGDDGAPLTMPKFRGVEAPADEL